MEYLVCFWCCKTRVELIVSKEKVEKDEKAACVVLRVRDCITWILAKNM